MPLFAEKHAYRCHPSMTMEECQQAIIKGLELLPSNYRFRGNEFHFRKIYWRGFMTYRKGMPAQVTGRLKIIDNQIELYWQTTNKPFHLYYGTLFGLVFILGIGFSYVFLFFTPFLLFHFLGYRAICSYDFFLKEEFIRGTLMSHLHLQDKMVETINLS